MASSAIPLRPYQPADFETLFRIDQACFPAGIAYGRAELKAYLRFEGARCLIAEASGEIAGFVLTAQTGERAHIVTMDVLEAHRRKKIGSLLLETAEKDAASQGVQRINLETATTNKAAIAFWRKHGYREVAVIKNYYGRGLDAFEMQKLLERKSGVKVSQ